MENDIIIFFEISSLLCLFFSILLDVFELSMNKLIKHKILPYIRSEVNINLINTSDRLFFTAVILMLLVVILLIDVNNIESLIFSFLWYIIFFVNTFLTLPLKLKRDKESIRYYEKLIKLEKEIFDKN